MKGILLAGGSGSRLHPITLSISKQLLPIYDKPMIYYPLSVLMQAGIKEVLVISTPKDINIYKSLLGNGKDIGIKINYAIQLKPEGIAQAFIIGEDFIENDSVCLILGDNLFHSNNLESQLKHASAIKKGGHIFGYKVSDPKSFGVIEFDRNNNVISIEEKPDQPKSNYAVTGLYFYDNDVIDITRSLKPSDRGELEITDINSIYLKEGLLKVSILGQDVAWLDTGSYDSLLEASIFIKDTQEKEGNLIASIEQVAYKNNWLNDNEINRLIKKYSNTPYGKSLEAAIKKDRL